MNIRRHWIDDELYYYCSSSLGLDDDDESLFYIQKLEEEVKVAVNLVVLL